MKTDELKQAVEKDGPLRSFLTLTRVRQRSQNNCSCLGASFAKLGQLKPKKW